MIGDGMNDVSMIQAAHIGVGISGVKVSCGLILCNPCLMFLPGSSSCLLCGCRHLAILLPEEIVTYLQHLELSTWGSGPLLHMAGYSSHQSTGFRLLKYRW